jgi:hypothetical protein
LGALSTESVLGRNKFAPRHRSVRFVSSKASALDRRDRKRTHE